MSNNKKNWIDPDPAIRISKTKSAPATERANEVNIIGDHGEVVATIYSSTDGNPILKCGAKVAIWTKHEARSA